MATAYTSQFAPGVQVDKKLTIVEFNASNGDDYQASLPFLYLQITDLGGGQVLLHTAPTDGEEIIIADHNGNASATPIQIRVGTVGHSIISAPDGIGINTDYGLVCLKYVATNSWAILYGR
jgi:hypothetical protein